ncbi:hypothetical protein LOZ53_000583 [Ophidiomyces ophidiicola]|nr:hypothetical protein LOZ55_001331 [Ophidiomyces ophidiicola]KAI1989268.1 hypothetical protein LOZ54_002914 [Ophidiomyces ophidiicola]KAI1997404.1 hypothetical protein LOZ53_000583 [Ophidiomyces ophidiicola]
MHFTEDEAVDVKSWVVRRLEDISDADSDVLADYVLALIRSDAPDEEIRQASIDNLEDFLKENTVSFVDEIFKKYNSKPKQAPLDTVLSTPSQNVPFSQPSSSMQDAQFVTSVAGDSNSPGKSAASQELGLGFGSRKRSFNDVSQGPDESDSYHRSHDRPFKAMRGRRGGRADRMGGGWDNRRAVPASQPPFPQGQRNGFPNVQAPPPGFPPFDANNPMATMLALQTMGFPQLPGMPHLPQVPAQGGAPPAKLAERCTSYDTQGFCVLGSTCPYQHGPDHLVAPSKDDEYDPTKSNIVTERPASANGTAGHTSSSRGIDRGRLRGRARGRGRGDREGFNSQKRGRAEFSQVGPNEDQSITTIVIEQIPEDKFDEQTIREFFSEFGNISEVTLKPYRHIALVKYDDFTAAKSAWSSPKVIFDNRFVKVYWYKPGNDETNGGTVPETPFDQEEFEKQQAEAQKLYEDKAKKRKETEEAMQALEKQKEQLFKRQQEEKAKLMERLGIKTTNNAENGEGVALNENQLEGVDASALKSNESEKTKQLRAQLAALEVEAQSLGLDPNASSEFSRGRGRGWAGYRSRGGFAPRGRGYDPSASRGGYRGRGSVRGRGGVMRLDNRPKRVAVSGVEFDANRDEALRQYLLTIGEYENIESNPDRSDSQIVTFKDRYIAEQLIYGSSNIPGVGQVEMTWVANVPVSLSAQPTTKQTDGDTAMGGDDSELLSMRKDTGHDVDYDVAEVDDSW